MNVTPKIPAIARERAIAGKRRSKKMIIPEAAAVARERATAAKIPAHRANEYLKIIN